MILLTPKFSENFEITPKDNVGMLEIDQVKDCFNNCFDENDGSKLYNEDFIEVFSTAVFETVEICTSASSDNSESVDANSSSDISFTDTDSNPNSIESSEITSVVNDINLNAIDTTVSSLENLEPGTYTLDVLESSDFDFDAVFVDSSSPNYESNTLAVCDENAFVEANRICNENRVLQCKEDDRFEDGAKKEYNKLKNFKTSFRKTLATKHPIRNVTAREFLNKFSNDLHKSEVKSSHEEESKSLSWLLDFNISSIFHPVENEADNFDRAKKKSNDTQKKPRYTYTELIEQALKEHGELTVSGIYNWISKHYSYYQQNDDRWKNSVRHNLSINPQFRKGKKASQGAGHFWKISDATSQSPESNNNHNFSNTGNNKEKSKSISKSINDIMNQIDEEVLAATRSIQENENMDFTDVSLHDAAEQNLQIDSNSKNSDSSSVHISISDIENLWESTHDTSDQRFTSFSPLIREITVESSSMEDENFLIQDINNSICLGDELFANGLHSPYYGLTTI